MCKAELSKKNLCAIYLIRSVDKMTLKSKIAEFIVKRDLIPKKLKWERNVDGIARVYSGAYNLLDSKGKKKLADMMYEWGVYDADEVVKILGIKRDLHGCAIALLTAHYTFGIKDSIVEEDENKVVMHISSCRWNGREDWNPALCASTDRYDHGLIKGINPNVKLVCTKRRSQGADVCEAILQKKDIHK
jgi:hypothetical protein